MNNLENVLHIPIRNNNNLIYDLSNIYTPRKFVNIDEYIIHIENLRKLKDYNKIVKHLEILNNTNKKLVKKSLNKLNWDKKLENNKNMEKTQIEIIKRKRCISNLDIKQNKNIINLPNIKNRPKSNLENKNYRKKIKKQIKIKKERLPKIM